MAAIDGNHLWVSQRAGPLTDSGIYYAITTRTKAAFGKSINPHLFRDCAATSIAVHDPANVQLARFALGHASYRTSQDYYNQALCIEASDSLNAAMDRLRHPRRQSGRRIRVSITPSEAPPQTDEACGGCGSGRRLMTSIW